MASFQLKSLLFRVPVMPRHLSCWDILFGFNSTLRESCFVG